MIPRNPTFTKLPGAYLFPEIARRTRQFQQKNRDAKLIRLGIGDTTEPLPEPIARAMAEAATALGTDDGYVGYGAEQGIAPLREQIAEKLYPGRIDADEIFISDGSKCDVGRLQMLFGGDVSIAVQDPTYPVYVDSGIILGQKIHTLPCTPENNFFPNLTEAPRTDLIYFCSPNNPTGAAATYEQLQQLITFARQNRSIIIFDSAYASYIRTPGLPKTIYEIPGAEEVAIEVGSFSKMAGFTGVRLGWSIVPKALRYRDNTPLWNDWSRLVSTVFNGASIIAQQGGLAALSQEGLTATKERTDFYLENAKLLREALSEYTITGGTDIPYLWVRVPGKTSWEAFQHLLEDKHLVTTPGSGFGPHGEGFVRFSAFGHRSDIVEAVERLATPANVI